MATVAANANTIGRMGERADLSLNRRRGALLGLAVGDALGAAVEFKSPGSFEPVSDYRGGGAHGLAPGEWTDDTSMALALADSIAERGWDLHHQAERYLTWWKTGEYSVTGRAFDIGVTTAASLRRFAATRDARTSGDDSPQASGNGSIMRLAPVPLAYMHLFPDMNDELLQQLTESSMTTHASPQCVSACAYMGIVLCGLLHGLPREEVLGPEFVRTHLSTHRLHPEIEEVAHGSYQRRSPIGSGYVVRSLEAALWAFYDAVDFREAVLRAVNLGDDADTTGAVCGQLAGAYFGESGIPQEWRDRLGGRAIIDPILTRLLRAP
jgi:ADP-ribosyl-[dinitrogen reductase] hydrolase